MLEIKIIRTYTDRSVTNGLLLVDGKQIGHTMEKPQRVGAYGKCVDNGRYVGKIVCSEYSPFTIRVTKCGRRFDTCLIPKGEYESIVRGICIGRNDSHYSLNNCDKVFSRLQKTLQQHICRGDRKISVIIAEDSFIEKTNSWRHNDDETADEDFFNDDDWN